MQWRDNLVYAVASGFALGVALQTFVEAPSWSYFAIALVALVLGLWAQVTSPVLATYVRLTGIALLFFVLGLWRMDAAQQQLQTPLLDSQIGREITVQGVVVREPEIRPRSLHVHIETEESRVLLIVDRLADIFYGDTVTATGRLQVPEPFAAELGRMFPYDGFLAARGVTHMMFYPDFAVVDSGGGNVVTRLLLRNKADFMERIERLIAEPQVGLGQGLLLGVKRAMSDETLAAFRTTGIIHIVVLSGYNVMLVVAFVRYIFGIFLPLRLQLVASFLAIVGFAITVGLTATVVRASIMASLLLLAQYLGRTYEALRGLFVAGAVMIAFNPYLLVYDIGFQLSFMATWGLILVAPHLEVLFATSPLGVKGRSYVIATIATQIAVTPLLLYHVGEFSTVSPLVNLLILPLVPVAMLFTFATGMVSLLSETLAQVFAVGAYLSLWYILAIAEGFADVPYAAVWAPAFPFVWVPVMYVAMAWGYAKYKRWQQRRRLRPSPAVATTIDVSDWTIEEIDAAWHQQQQARIQPSTKRNDTGTSAAASPQEASTPIFFRK